MVSFSAIEVTRIGSKKESETDRQKYVKRQTARQTKDKERKKRKDMKKAINKQINSKVRIYRKK